MVQSFQAPGYPKHLRRFLRRVEQTSEVESKILPFFLAQKSCWIEYALKSQSNLL